MLLVGATAAAASPAAAAPVLPAPSYDATLHVQLYAYDLYTQEGVDRLADLFATRGVKGGPYARVGAAEYFAVDLPWTADRGHPVITAPSRDAVRTMLGRLRDRGLTMHMSLMNGMSRAPWIYAEAKREDRRNAQWFSDGGIGPAIAPGSGETDEHVAAAYVTTSRYARKLRRHMEVKLRAYAKELVALRREFPETLVTVSGDAEAELDPDRIDPALPYEQQPIADYSPFAILEFRDWLLHAGLYAPGGPYDGEGYVQRPGEVFVQGGAAALASSNVAAFNAAFGTGLRTFELRYFHWSLDDGIDGDSQAIPLARYGSPGFDPLPASGPASRVGGFDAPRSWIAPPRSGARFWEVWLQFREVMLNAYTRDVARWVVTTEDAAGERFPAARWYSHQIPGDYLNGRYPGGPAPLPRLLTSASTLQTALLPVDHGEPGWTILDVWNVCPGGVGGCYERTSQYLFANPGLPGVFPASAGAIPALGLRSFGAPEYTPSWWNAGPDLDLDGIVAQYRRARAAGAHLLGLTPYDHFAVEDYRQNAHALARFLEEVKFEPRDADRVAYAPPPVAGLAGQLTRSGGLVTGALSWGSEPFPSAPGLRWVDWPDFATFEVLRGATDGFAPADGQVVGRVRASALPDIRLDRSRPWYRVRGVSDDGLPGDLSAAVLLATPGPSPTPTVRATPRATPPPRLRSIAPCRLLDTRLASGGGRIPAGESRVIQVTGRCRIPATATAVALSVRSFGATSPGSLVLSPGAAPAGTPLQWAFSARRTSTRRATALLDTRGAITLGTGAGGGVPQVIVDVTGWRR